MSNDALPISSLDIRGSVLTIYMAGVVNKIRVISGFGLQVMLVGSLGVSDPCTS